MTTPSLFDLPAPLASPPPGRKKERTADTMLCRVHDLFIQRVGQWIDSQELAAVGGRCAWRTRVSDCRRVLGMDICNRQRRITKPDGTSYVVSEYGYNMRATEGQD